MHGAHELLDSLGGCRRVLLTGPVQPDGDSLGACLALQRVLQGHHIECVVTGEANHRYARLPGIEHLLSDDSLGDYDGVVILDGDRHRLPPGALRAFETTRLRGIIDHHASTRQDGYTHFWVSPSTASTCEMLYRAFIERDEVIDKPVAHALYAGAVFDTGGFRYSNTTPATHQMAADLLARGIDHTSICIDILMDRRAAGLRLAGHVFSTARFHFGGQVLIGTLLLADLERLGARSGDVEGIVESLVHTKGVEVSVLCIERAPASIKLSLRSRGTVDVASLARRLNPGGGGHKKAAGVTLDLSIVAAEKTVLDALAQNL